jgi:hypothetical protein
LSGARSPNIVACIRTLLPGRCQAGDLEAAVLFQELGADEQTHSDILRLLFDKTLERAPIAVG